MLKEQIKKVLSLYQENLKKKIFGEEIFPENERNPSQAEALRYAKWMINQTLVFLESPEKEQKAQRWLGFIQGILWCCAGYSIKDLRNHNR